MIGEPVSPVNLPDSQDFPQIFVMTSSLIIFCSKS
jgi:hypothetical protein